jgi:hypothetical protein
MLTGTCHCGTLRISIPQAPKELTNCNCSICRRLGTLWGYYRMDEVQVQGHPEHTQEYIQGDKMLRVVRCKHCGCTACWEPLPPDAGPATRMGVNIRNFDPKDIGEVRIKLLDGADSWKSFYWEDLEHAQQQAQQQAQRQAEPPAPRPKKVR